MRLLVREQGALTTRASPHRQCLGLYRVDQRGEGQDNIVHLAGHRMRRQSRRPISVLQSARVVALILIALAGTVGSAQASQPGLHVEILGIRNSIGAVACALFEGPGGFPTEFLRFATNIMMVQVRATKATCDFADIAPGTYALAVIHDENRDGELATNWMGKPQEGYGFSNDAKGTLGAPSFEAASFAYNGERLNMTIALHY